jgi:site-specific DNA-methyltransferase (adenine-specific)
MIIELNGIYNIDCVEGMKGLIDECIDLTVTSPPYDNLRTYNGFEWNFEETVKELYRVTKQGGVVVWIVNDATIKGSETGTSFLFFKECGFNLHDTMIWFKPNCFNFGSNCCYKQSFEYMFIFSKGKPKTINLIKDIKAKSAGKIQKGARKHADGKRDKVPDFICSEYKRRFNVWSIPLKSYTKGHPAIYPLQLAKDHILSWSNKGDVILDPFIGSGTTAVAALETNRNFIGFDISKEYCDMANEHLKTAFDKMGVF